MYLASPVSPVMPEPNDEVNEFHGPSIGNSGSKSNDIKPYESPSLRESRLGIPTIDIRTSSKEFKRSPSATPSPSRKRKFSHSSKSDTEVGKKSKTFEHFYHSVSTMNLDINDIEMPGRSGSTRSRTKVPSSERRRVPVACDSCRHRKIRCNGTSPCQNCLKNSLDCHFPPVSAKIVVEENWVERLHGRCHALEKALMEAIPDPERREEIAAHYGLRLIMSTSSSDRSDSEPASAVGKDRSPNGEGPNEIGYDAEAYASFIGDSASLTFMNKVREFMRATYHSIPDLGQVAKQPAVYAPSEGFHHPLRPQVNTFQLDPVTAFLSGADSNGLQSQSPALSLPSTDPYILPPKPTVASLIQRFVAFLGCGTTPDMMSPSGGVYHWFDAEKLSRDLESLYTSVNMGMLGMAEQSKPVDYTVLCMMNAVLALACQATASSGVGPLDVEEEAIAGDAYFWRSFVPRRTSTGDRAITPEQTYTPTSPNTSTSDYSEPNPSYFVTEYEGHSGHTLVARTATFQPGMTFFARAKALMVNPSDAPSLSTVKTLSMLSYFLLSINRWEAAYLHIGLAVRLAVANGLHRRKSFPVGAGISEEERLKQREEEERKRSFWTIYVLDRLLSCMTGRPVMLSDEAIDTDLPADVDGLPSASGLRAHVQLSKIMGDIITYVYPIRRAGDTPQSQHQAIMQAIQKSHVELHNWHENLPSELKLVSGVARERSVLWLHSLYNELLMITCRPNLLLAIKRSSASMYSPTQPLPTLPQYIYDHANICTSAAGSNLLLARQIQASGWVFASFTECSFIFNAGMTLLLARLIAPPGQEWQSSARQYEEDVQYAIAFLSTLGKGGNRTAERYTKELMGLNVAVNRLIQGRELSVDIHTLTSSPPSMSMQQGAAASGFVSPMGYQATLRDFEVFNPEFRDLLDASWRT